MPHRARLLLTRPVLSLMVAGCLALAMTTCVQAPTTQPAPSPAVETGEGSSTKLSADFHNTDLGNGWQRTSSLELAYAQCFAVDYYEGGYALACLADGARYLVVPEGAEAPDGLAEDIVVLQAPIQDVYLVASDTMCLFDALDAMDCITVSGIERDDWSIAAARAAMDDGRIVYGGKYRAPDYELLVSKGVALSIQSTMINHTPEVREKLIELGIPVLTELSSYEPEPLGRAEWIRLYGVLCNKEGLAQEVFEEQVAHAASIDAQPTGKTVAFFYLNANGAAVVRRPGDYVTTMIDQAGGVYAFDDLEAAAAGSSSTTLEMEQFYATAKDADVLIYNATIDDGVDSLDALLQRNSLLADFKAVREGNVWLCSQNMYQQMIATGDIIADFNAVLRGVDSELTYVRRLA